MLYGRHSGAKHLKCQCLRSALCLTPRKQKNLYGVPTSAQALPYDMEYHTVNNEEHPGSRLRWLAGAGFPLPEKDSELNGCLCSYKRDHCAWPRWTADV